MSRGVRGCEKLTLLTRLAPEPVSSALQRACRFFGKNRELTRTDTVSVTVGVSSVSVLWESGRTDTASVAVYSGSADQSVSVVSVSCTPVWGVRTQDGSKGDGG